MSWLFFSNRKKSELTSVDSLLMSRDKYYAASFDYRGIGVLFPPGGQEIFFSP
jgi:hypothetical protein